MSVIRVEKTKNYTVMSNYHLKEKNMSLKAKGLLSLMLSLPDDWDYTLSGLISLCKENETAIRSALDELKEFGYLKVTKNMPTQDNGGRINYDYEVYEKPITKEENQGLENPDVENQYVENPLLLNTNIQNTNIQNTKSNKINIVLQQNIKCIVDYLNESTDKNFSYDTKGTVNLIKARFKEGYKLDDFYDVIDKKVKEWKNTEMDKYLRPETLFGNKFEGYLNSKITSTSVKTSYSSYVDNTANHFTGNKPISDEEFDKLDFENKKQYVGKMALKDMTPYQRKFYDNNCLARDEFGNLIKF